MMLRSTTLLLLIFLSGCASTEITSVRDPEYAVEIFRNPVVHASVIGLKYQKALEAALIKSFSKRANSTRTITSTL